MCQSRLRRSKALLVAENFNVLLNQYEEVFLFVILKKIAYDNVIYGKLFGKEGISLDE